MIVGRESECESASGSLSGQRSRLKRSDHARPPEATPRSLAVPNKPRERALVHAKIDRMNQKHLSSPQPCCFRSSWSLLVTAAVALRLLPTGVPGEWEWNRLPDWARLAVGRALHRLPGRGRLRRLRRARVAASCRPSDPAIFEAAAVMALFFASVCVQVIVPMGAPPGYDLTKWASVNYLPGSSGLLSDRPRKGRTPTPGSSWPIIPIGSATQDVFHIGTHPPGLIAAQCVLLRVMDRNPRLSGRAARSHASLGRRGLSRLRQSQGPSRLSRATGPRSTPRPS